ncbi:MAG: flagellar biosynthesis anti-sigma factor FlgM [Akkermansiaceae bacterium]|nr:flagellar biosynthesis anti-sigma factor FlgM [Armatimonadota bacterium]
MQITGEDLVRTSIFVGVHHNSDTAATLEAPDTTSNSTGNVSDRAAWVRVARTEGITTAPNKPRQSPVSPIIGTDPISNETRSEIEHVVHQSEAEPDVREGIVASLRERIESGTYFVGAETIAEMMIRRTVADQLR